MTETRKTFCRICTVLCGLEIEVDGERIVSVKGDRDHKLSKGYTCPKGRALDQLHHHPDAILQPRMGRGEASRGVDWETALDDLAERLRRTIDTHGPASVGIFMGSGLGMDAAGYRMAETFLAGVGTPAKFSPLTIDGTAKTLVASLVGQFPGLSSRPHYDTADLLLFVGINPLVSHGHNVALPENGHTIKQVAKRGAVWVIDPRRNETARLANRHLAPRPGSDYALLAYLVRDILARSAQKPAQAVEGMEELRQAVEPFSLECAARLTGLPKADIEELRAALERSGTVAIETGTGVTMAPSANLTQWLGWVLMILTGSMNRPGGVWFHPGFVNRLDAAELPILPDVRHPGAPTRPDLPGMIGEWPCAALVNEIENGNIRALVNFGGAIARSFPESARLEKALGTLETFVSFDIVENETTALSTHVLPTKDQLEREDIQLWDVLSPRVQLQHTDRVVEPRGERRSAWWAIAELMRRMGMEVPEDVPTDDGAPEADRHMLARLMPHARRDFSEVVEQKAVCEELEFPGDWVDAHVARIGGWKLAPPDLLEQLAHFLAQAADSTRPESLQLIPRRQRRKLNASPLELGESGDLLIHPEDAALLQLNDGQLAHVATNAGSVKAPARYDASMRRGVVSLPHGHRDINVNMLTRSSAADPLTGMAEYSGFAVEVSPA